MANMSIKEPWETPGRSQSGHLHNSDLSDIPYSRLIYYKLKVFMYLGVFLLPFYLDLHL